MQGIDFSSCQMHVKDCIIRRMGHGSSNKPEQGTLEVRRMKSVEMMILHAPQSDCLQSNMRWHDWLSGCKAELDRELVGTQNATQWPEQKQSQSATQWPEQMQSQSATLCPERIRVRSATQWPELIRLLSEKPADIILLKRSSQDLLKDIVTIKSWYPKMRIIVICSAQDRKTGLRVIAMGIDGLLPEDIGMEEFRSAVCLCASGYAVIRTDAFQRVITRYERLFFKQTGGTQRNGRIRFDAGIRIPSSFRVEELRENEKAVLQLLLGGKTNKQIAAQLFLSEGHVKNIITHLLRMSGTRNREQMKTIFSMENPAG